MLFMAGRRDARTVGSKGGTMPWQNQSGGGGGGGGPWGRGPRGGGGSQPPNLEELLRRGQDQFRGMLPSGFNKPRWLILGLLVIAFLWGVSGFYRVQPDEQGVVLRFGKWIKTTQPGLNYHLPYPIETAFTPKVTRENNIDIGFTTAGGAQRDVPAESLMLTGDENIVDIGFSVVWVIKDAGKFLFNIREPELTVRAVSESAIREIVGKTPIQSALTEGRQDIENQTRELVQQALDEYEAGIEIRRLKLQKVDPPQEVIDAFRDVQAARADQERLRNEAEAYENDILPRARGQAEKILQDAEAYKEQIVAQAEGEAARFTSVYNQYSKAKDVTRKRMYIDTMQEVLSGMNKIIIDKSASGSGVVPYLPLPELQKARPQSNASAGTAGQPASQGGQ
jgi:modulator of FtsH protease HflK